MNIHYIVSLRSRHSFCKIRYTALIAIVAAATGLLTAQHAKAQTPTVSNSIPIAGGGVNPDTSTVLTSPPASGTPYFTYNSSTGDVKFIFNGLAAANPHYVTDIGVQSASGDLLINNYAFKNGAFATNNDPQFVDNVESSTPGYGNTGTVTVDLGDILNTGLTNSELGSDLTLGWTQNGEQGSLNTTDDMGNGFFDAVQAQMVVTPVPEPASLSLLGLGALGLLGGRRLRRRGAIAAV